MRKRAQLLADLVEPADTQVSHFPGFSPDGLSKPHTGASAVLVDEIRPAAPRHQIPC
jgi:hypothetical protein